MAVTISGLRTRTLTTDADFDGQADPGDVYSYDVIVTNSGNENALLLQLDVTENGFTIDPGSVKIGPIAVDDVFNITGNTPVVITKAQLVGNDIDPDDVTANFTITNLSSGTNGTVVDNGDGTYTFTPATGFEGVASFTYQLLDEDGVASVAATPGNVTINVSDPVWYVDMQYSGANGASDGSYLKPFTQLTQLNGLTGDGTTNDDVDGTGDTIFVYARGANAYNSGITLESGQTLRGEGVAADFVVNGLTISSVQTDTQIEYQTYGVTLDQNNTVLGVDFVGENATGVAIRDNGGSVGTLNVSDVEVDGIGQIIDIDNGGNLNVTFQSVTSHGSSGVGGVIDLDGVAAGTALTGTFTVNGFTTMDNGSGTHNQVGISIGGNNTNLVSNFAGGTSLNMGPNGSAAGIDLGANSGSTTFAGLAVATQTANGFVANNAGTLTVTGAGNSVTTTTGQILSITNTLVGATDVNFNVLSSSGTVTGNAITLSNVDNNDVVISNLTVAGATADGVNVSTGSSTNVAINTATINNTTGDGIEINDSSGAFSIAGGNIGNTNDPGGRTVNIIGGTGAIDIDANLFKSSSLNVVVLTGHSAGDVNFGGNITASGGGVSGIFISNNSGNISFTGASKVLNVAGNGGISIQSNSANVSFQNGGLDIDTTTSSGIAAGTYDSSTGGTLVISGSNNTITTTSGPAIVMHGTDIGGGGVTLQSVNSDGGSNTTIWLKDAGSGGFTITGTGSTAASGGAIANKSGTDGLTTSGIGIYVENTSNISLNNIAMSGTFGNFGIRGNGVTNFTLRDSTMSGQFGSSNAADEDAIRFGTQSSSTNGLTGTALFEGNNISGGYESNITIYNYGSGSLNLTVRDSANDAAVIGSQGVDLGGGVHTGNDGILVETAGTSAFNLTILVDGVTFTAGRGDFLQVAAGGNTVQNITVQNNTFHNAHVNVVSGGGGITLGGAGNTSNYTATYLIQNNSFKGAEGPAIAASYGGQSANVSGVILNNTIGTLNGAVDSAQGSTGSNGGGSGIYVSSERFAGTGTVNHAVRIENNTITDIISGVGGIYLRSNDQGGGGTNRVEATILNNTIAEGGDFMYGGIYAIVGGSDSTDPAVMGLDIRGNTINLDSPGTDNDADGNAIVLDQISPEAHFYVPGYAGSGQGEWVIPSGTASTGLSSFWTTSPRVNTLTNGDFPNNTTGGVDAGLVDGLTGGAFVLAVPILAAPAQPLDWEAGLADAQQQWLDAQNSAGDAIVTTQPYGDPIPVDDDGGAITPQPYGDPIPVDADDGILTQAELDSLVEAAIERWIDAGATDEQVAAMRSASFSVADMSGAYLASSTAGSVQVDSDGAGFGWFLDSTPGDDSEYSGSGTRLTADAGGSADGRMDLLTVLMHELGHQVGLDDLYQSSDSGELMYGYGQIGTRRLASADDLDGADLDHPEHASYVVLTPTVGTLPAGKAVRVIYDATVDSFSNEVIGNPFSNNVTIKGSNFSDVAIGAESLTVDSLTLGNRIFGDTNGNGIYDVGDTGIDGVALTLFVDNGSVAGAFDATDTQVATTTTAGGGFYAFANLAAGDYIVRVDAGNFTGGGALTGRVNSPGTGDPDNNIDNDDNGVAGIGGATVSQAITLDYNSEPTAGTGNDTNNTLDFGFFAVDAEDDSFATDEDTPITSGNVLDDNGNGADSGGAVTAVNGNAGDVGNPVILPSGAELTLNSDGTFAYDPNGAFDETPTSSSGASNQPATDSFTYELDGGDTATVTITIDGVDTDDTLVGTAGNDVLDGGAGADSMSGGLGDDEYFVDNSGDVVIENLGEGLDVVRSTVSFSLAGQDIERLVLNGANPIDGTGNGLDNGLAGSSADNRLDGAGGADKMSGGLGNDTYVVDNAGDYVKESAGAGTDTVEASVNYHLNDNVENLTLTGGTATRAVGNSLANVITGNDIGNVLDGRGGADTINGGDGNDRIYGGTGADTMSGGLGDDTFYVDNAGDAVIEGIGGGFDVVRSSVAFSLAGQDVERLVLTGAGAIDGTGNGLNNVISGTSAANRLDGGGGADKMAGGGGNDTYVVDDAGDYVKERSGGGTDTVEASANYHITDHVENLILTGAVATRAVGNSLDNAITGNGIGNVLDGRGGADVIDGGGGDDRLYGREGNDTLTGGSGADKFVFDSALGAGNVDSITDFATGVDRIQLDDDIFTAFVGPGSLDPAAFRAGTSAQDGDDRIIYDSSTGNIYYDSDGLGGTAQVLFAQLVPGTALASGDFLIGG